MRFVHSPFTYYLLACLGFISSLTLFFSLFYFLVWRSFSFPLDIYITIYFLLIMWYFFYQVRHHTYTAMMVSSSLPRYFLSGFRTMGHVVSSVINFFLLFVVYFTAIAFVSLFFKLRGKHFLDTQKKSASSYWKDYRLSKKPLASYLRQF